MTDNIFSIKSPVNVNSVGFDGKMSVADAMSIFQYAVTLHTEEMGVGFNSVLNNHGAKWVIAKARFEITRFPANGETIKAVTWPLKPGVMRFGRCFSIRDEQEFDCINAYTDWCLLDKNTSEVLKTSILGELFPQYLTERKDGKYSNFTLDVTQQNLCYKRTMRLSDLDINGHVNNISYIRMALDCFSGSEMKNMTIKSFEMIYRRQCFEKETLALYRADDGDGCYIEARAQNGDVVFTATVNK